jgi:ABC-2 type transport system ATP-binding protein
MKILLTKVGKRYNRDWIFRHLDYEFSPGTSYAITGPNGSGKSTLLQVVAGAVVHTEGTLSYHPETRQNGNFDAANAYQFLSIAAPYLELIEEMTLLEFLQFHAHFKPFLNQLPFSEIASTVGLKSALNKQIRYFSSGMKQRTKLAQAIFSDTPVVLLDEPCTNLDEEGIELYHRLIAEYGRNRLIIVSSNDKQEYDFCDKRLSILDYKILQP